MIKLSVEKKNIKKILGNGGKILEFCQSRKTGNRDNTEDTVSSTVPNLTSQQEPTFHLSSEFIGRACYHMVNRFR